MSIVTILAAAAVAAAVAGAPAPAWDVKAQLAPLDGAKNVRAVLMSEATLTNGAGQLAPAAMGLTCRAGEGRLITFLWPSYVGDADGRVAVSWRVGAGPVESATGYPAAGGRGVLLLNGETERLYAAMTDGAELVVRVNGYSDTQDATFRLADVSRAKAAC